MLHTLGILALGLQFGQWGAGALNYILVAVIDRRRAPNDKTHQTGRNMLRFLGLSVVWTFTFLLCCNSLGFNITQFHPEREVMWDKHEHAHKTTHAKIDNFVYDTITKDANSRAVNAGVWQWLVDARGHTWQLETKHPDKKQGWME